MEIVTRRIENSQSVATSDDCHRGEWVDTTEEAMVSGKDLDMFVTLQLLEDSPAALSLVTTASKIGIHMNGKKVKHQILSTMEQLYFASAPTLSSFLVYQVKLNLMTSAEDSAENIKELTPADKETTRASK